LSATKNGAQHTLGALRGNAVTAVSTPLRSAQQGLTPKSTSGPRRPAEDRWLVRMRREMRQATQSPRPVYQRGAQP
jgi:hypothetical protein